MENRNGLIVDVEVTHASGAAESEAATKMLWRRHGKYKRATVGADKGYDCKAFIKGCLKLKLTPNWAAKAHHSAIDGRTKRHEGYKTSMKVCKRIEEALGWIKTVSGLAKTKLIGQAKWAGQALMCFAAYNLVRMGSLSQWLDAHHALTGAQRAQKGLADCATVRKRPMQVAKTGLQLPQGRSIGCAVTLMSTFSMAC